MAYVDKKPKGGKGRKVIKPEAPAPSRKTFQRGALRGPAPPLRPPTLPMETPEVLYRVHGIQQANGDEAWFKEDEIKQMGLVEMVIGDDLKKKMAGEKLKKLENMLTGKTLASLRAERQRCRAARRVEKQVQRIREIHGHVSGDESSETDSTETSGSE